MIPAVIQAWRDRKKADGYCQFCWKRKARATKSLCATCRKYKVSYQERKRKEEGKPVRVRFKHVCRQNIQTRPVTRVVLPEKIPQNLIEAAYEREQIRKLEREESQRKATRSAWLQEHRLGQRA